MAFFPPIPLIRKKLTESNAFSKETAKTFSGLGKKFKQCCGK